MTVPATFALPAGIGASAAQNVSALAAAQLALSKAQDADVTYLEVSEDGANWVRVLPPSSTGSAYIYGAPTPQTSVYPYGNWTAQLPGAMKYARLNRTAQPGPGNSPAAVGTVTGSCSGAGLTDLSVNVPAGTGAGTALVVSNYTKPLVLLATQGGPTDAVKVQISYDGTNYVDFNTPIVGASWLVAVPANVAKVRVWRTVKDAGSALVVQLLTTGQKFEDLVSQVGAANKVFNLSAVPAAVQAAAQAAVSGALCGVICTVDDVPVPVAGYSITAAVLTLTGAAPVTTFTVQYL